MELQERWLAGVPHSFWLAAMAGYWVCTIDDPLFRFFRSGHLLAHFFSRPLRPGQRLPIVRDLLDDLLFSSAVHHTGVHSACDGLDLLDERQPLTLAISNFSILTTSQDH